MIEINEVIKIRGVIKVEEVIKIKEVINQGSDQYQGSDQDQGCDQDQRNDQDEGSTNASHWHTSTRLYSKYLVLLSIHLYLPDAVLILYSVSSDAMEQPHP